MAGWLLLQEWMRLDPVATAPGTDTIKYAPDFCSKAWPVSVYLEWVSRAGERWQRERHRFETVPNHFPL